MSKSLSDDDGIHFVTVVWYTYVFGSLKPRSRHPPDRSLPLTSDEAEPHLPLADDVHFCLPGHTKALWAPLAPMHPGRDKKARIRNTTGHLFSIKASLYLNIHSQINKAYM